MKIAARTRDYTKLRRIFLTENKFCSVCGRMASDVHHKKGRIGWRLLAVETWIAVCRECHNRIESHPKWAKENGYSENRK